MSVKALFRLRIRTSSKALISSGCTVAKLVKNLSEVANFGPTKCAAEIVISMLETAKEVQENKDECLLLISRVVDFLLQLQDLSDKHPNILLESLQLKMQDLEMELHVVHMKMKCLLKRKLLQRILARDEIKSIVSACEYRLETALNSFQLWLAMDTNSAIQEIIASVEKARKPLCNEKADSSQISTMESEDELDNSGFQRFHHSEVELESRVNSAQVFFSGLTYAEIRGKKRLIRFFDGYDTNARTEWLHEINKWRLLHHVNLPQMIGYSSRKSASLFVAFKDVDIKCIATYVEGMLRNQDIMACSDQLIAFFKDAAQAIDHIQKQLALDARTSAALVQEAAFTLNSSNNIVMAFHPRTSFKRAHHKGYAIRAVLLELYHKLVPPSDTGLEAITAYMHSLCGESRHVDSSKFGTGYRAQFSQIRNIVNRVALLGEATMSPEDQAQDSMTSHEYINPQNIAQPGDYGILHAGESKTCTFVRLGSINKDSPGLFSSSATSVLWEYMPTMQKLKPVQETPFVWEMDFTHAKNEGFEIIFAEWGHSTSLGITPHAASQFLVYSAPLFATSHEDWQDIVFVTKMDYYEMYEFTIRDLGMDMTRQPTVFTSPAQPLPMIFAIERENGKDAELIFTQSRLPSQAKPAISDDRIQFKKGRIVKAIDYVQLSRDQYLKEIKAPRREYFRKEMGTRTIRWKEHGSLTGLGRPLFMREYEASIEPCSPFYEIKPSSKEI